MIRAGQLRHQVTIQQLVAASPTQNAGGEIDESWSTLATAYASIEPLKGRELFAAQQVVAEVTGVIRIRYRAGITAKMRCVFNSRNYEILSVVNPAERNQELLLYVREGPNAG